MHNLKDARVLAIDLYTRGFCFAVLETREHLLDYGSRIATGDRTQEILQSLDKIIVRYKPEVLVMEDCPPKESKRCKRIQGIVWAIINLASSRKLYVYRFTRERVRHTFAATGKTKYDIAAEIGRRYMHLAKRIPPKR